MQTVTTDHAVIGAGLAGLWAVLHLPGDRDVLVIDKGGTSDTGSSPWAQGGMAVAVHPGDSPELHAKDTLRAGAGACARAAVEVLVSEAWAALDELTELGCAFDREPSGDLHLNHEGGQTVARSVHAQDATGREIMRVVLAAAKLRARRLVGTVVRVLEVDGRCIGARVVTDDGPVDVLARSTLLATGGCGALYGATTNPPSATGDGIALAHAAGAAVSDLEFVQFHPTALAAGGHRRVLLTEALRGEGALVVDADGHRFLFDHHPAGELGPRDVVSRAIAARDAAFLDARPIGADGLAQRFPNVMRAAAEAGFDLGAEPVPISPAAHYFLGGVVTDLDGRTTLDGLYAAGECATTGLHGANRMAGNSLTEAVVFGRRAAVAMAAADHDRPDDTLVPRAIEDGAPDTARPEDWEDLRRAMSEGAGPVRTAASLAVALDACGALAASTRDPLLRLAASAAASICRAASLRTESRGVHHREDHPDRDPGWDGVHLSHREPTPAG